MKDISIFILFFLFFTKIYAQDYSKRDSIDRVIKKAFKGKKVILTDIIDDSSARTFEVFKHPKSPMLACSKYNRDSTTTENHFYFLGDSLLKISITTWDWRRKTASFDYYYSIGGKMNMMPLTDLHPGPTIEKLVRISKELFARYRILRDP